MPPMFNRTNSGVAETKYITWTQCTTPLSATKAPVTAKLILNQVNKSDGKYCCFTAISVDVGTPNGPRNLRRTYGKTKQEKRHRTARALRERLRRLGTSVLVASAMD